MENTYKFLKILIAVLAVAVVLAGIWYFSGSPAAKAPEATVAVTVPEESTENPDLAPDFTVYDVDGNAYKLSDFRGKPVILNFWASWCGPCKAEMPEFENAYVEYGDQIHFIIVDLVDGQSETVESGSAYVTEMGYTFPVYFDTDMEAAFSYQVSAIPMSIFIDAQGIVVNSHVGMISADELQQNIDTLLASN